MCEVRYIHTTLHFTDVFYTYTTHAVKLTDQLNWHSRDSSRLR